MPSIEFVYVLAFYLIFFNSTSNGTPLVTPDFRLPQTLVPVTYNLTLKTFLPCYGADIPSDMNNTFRGVQIIKFFVRKATSRIELNARGLEFHSDLATHQLFQGSDVDLDGILTEFGADLFMTPYSITSAESLHANTSVILISVDKTLEKVHFYLDKDLREGQVYFFKTLYNGFISTDEHRGLYLIKYKTGDVQRCGAATYFGPTYARRMMPCFDEPEFKATFNLRVVHPRGSHVVSNTKELVKDQPTEKSEWLITTFAETPKMSSYLLALVISDFEFTEGYTKRGVRVAIWARPEAVQQHQNAYALLMGIQLLELFEDFFGIPYPLPKLDMVALIDFLNGAMENWGLITFHESKLLIRSDDANERFIVALVIAHELAHQWFGNLVTMKWWSNLWLNEGFATFMANLAIGSLNNEEFNMELEKRRADKSIELFKLNDQGLAHPLYNEPGSNTEIKTMFTPAVTYTMGSYILSMISALMGNYNFMKGIIIYLNRHKYQNVEPSDLWDALNEAVPDTLLDWNNEKLRIDVFAGPWIKQRGLPVVEAKLRQVEAGQNQTIELTAHNNDNDMMRQIPIWYSMNGTEKKVIWLQRSAMIDGLIDAKKITFFGIMRISVVYA